MLAILEEAFGPDNPNVATALNEVAMYYYVRGHYAEAEPLYRRTLAMREKVLGLDHPDVATTLTNLSYSSTSRGCYGEAEPLVKRALAIRNPNAKPTSSECARLHLMPISRHHSRVEAAR
jgi:Tfp pilus assembly protein PilF